MWSETDRQTDTQTHTLTQRCIFLPFFLPNEVGSAEALLVLIMHIAEGETVINAPEAGDIKFLPSSSRQHTAQLFFKMHKLCYS